MYASSSRETSLGFDAFAPIRANKSTTRDKKKEGSEI
jgi:hypothetical protein